MRWWREWWVAVVIVAVAAVVRFHDPAGRSLGREEIDAVVTATAPAAEFFSSVRSLPGAAPLYFWGLRQVAAYGFEEERLRGPSALFGVGGVLALIILANSLLGRRTALLAGALLAVSPIHVAFSRQARPYALFACLTVVLLWLLWEMINRGARLLPALLAGILAAYTHYYALLVLAGVAVHALRTGLGPQPARGRAARVGVAAALVFFSFAPWVVYDLAAGAGGQLALSLVDWSTPATVARAFVVGEEARGSPVLVAAAAVIAGIGVLGAAVRNRAAAILVLSVVVAGMSGAMFLAWWAPYPFAPVQVLFLLPLWMTCVADGVGWIADHLPRQAKAPVWALLAAATVAVSGASIDVSFREPPSDWRAAAKAITANLGRDDAVVAPGAHRPLRFYAPELERRLGTDERPRTARSRLHKAARAWLLAPAALWLQPDWRRFEEMFRWRVVVDLSPSAEPRVYYLTYDVGRAETYMHVCHFDLPVAALARQTVVRDCLGEVGLQAGPLALVESVVRDGAGLPLRNPSLLQAVTILAEAGYYEHARGLAARLAAAEPQWLAARQAEVAVDEMAAISHQ